MHLVYLFPVVLPERFEHISPPLLVLCTIPPIFLHLYYFTIRTFYLLYYVILLRTSPWASQGRPGHHLQRLDLVFIDVLVQIGSPTIDDLAFGSVNNDEFPLLLVILILNYSVDIFFFIVEKGFIEDQDGNLRGSLLGMTV